MKTFSCAAFLSPALILGLFAAGACAQGVHHPFAIGVNEGAASATGVSGWILAQESAFYRLLTGAVRAVKESGAGAFALAGLSFGYGVFHAAGPGHGKAVIASYMLADERQLRRGLLISLAAAFLQGLVAVALVGIAFLILGTTARRMTGAAGWIEIASYAGVVALGAWLTASKGSALLAAWRQARMHKAPALAAFGPLQAAGGPADGSLGAQFLADDASSHLHGAGCGCAIDPAELGADFSWRKALLTVVAAGSRPCSGAILVLVFASAQGVFLAGVGAVAAMSAGVAITTGALASLAVFAKTAAARLAGAGSVRAAWTGRIFEAAAALAGLVFGLLLLSAALSGQRVLG